MNALFVQINLDKALPLAPAERLQHDLLYPQWLAAPQSD